MTRRTMPQQQRQQAGLTLIEIMVGLIVLSVLLAIAAPSMSDLLDRRRVIATADEVANIMNYAKAETNAVNIPTLVRFDTDTSGKMSCIAVTDTGTAGNTCYCWKAKESLCSGSSARLLRLIQQPNDYVQFAASAVDWGESDPMTTKVFRDLISVEAKGLHVDVVGKRGNKLMVQVSPSGKIRVCSPDGKMSGYAQC